MGRTTFIWTTKPRFLEITNPFAATGEFDFQTQICVFVIAEESTLYTLYIYINYEPLIYIRIYKYGVHRGKVLNLANAPGRKIILNIQAQEDINTEDITCLSTLL